MNHEDINWDALVNYISGQSSLSEEEMIREWIKLDSKNEEFIVFLKSLWDSSAEEKRPWDVDSAWMRFNEEYNLPFSDEKEPVMKKQKNSGNDVYDSQTFETRHRYSWFAVATSIVIISVVLFSLDLSNYNTETAAKEAEPVYREIVTKNGQRTHLNLSDGSRVILNAGSRLLLPEVFGSESPREVTLSGEAWFEVEHNPDQPFIVYSEDAVTTVLGTKFQVRSYPEENQVEVVVSEGKVALHDQSKPDGAGATIAKNQVGIFSGNGYTTVSTVTDLSSYLGWKEGKLVFDQEPLERVMRKLQRWYDVDIQIDPAHPELNRKELTASFTENQPIAEVLETIALTLDIEYRKADGRFAFHFFNENQNRR